MIKGNCTGDKNPEWWFPDLPSGQLSNKRLQSLTNETQYALNLCSTCPVKQECLEEGMKMEKMRGQIMGWGNLPFGIWGGLMPYERLEMAGITPENSKGVEVSKAFGLKRKLESLLIRR